MPSFWFWCFFQTILLSETVSSQNAGLALRCLASQVGRNSPQYFTKPPTLTQPPTLSRTGNEYQPKCGDAVWLGSKCRYGSVHLWINVWVKLCDLLLTRAIPEHLRDERLVISTIQRGFLYLFVFTAVGLSRQA